MKRTLTLAALLLLPVSVSAAATSTYVGERSVFVATTSPGNLYVAGATVAVTASTSADLSAFGGSVVVTAPVASDALLGGGSLSVRAPVSGDVRLFGGSISVEAPIGGDLLALGGSVVSQAAAHGVFAAAAEVSLLGGAKGSVTVYANNVVLGGDFAGDVRVVAGGRVALEPGTTIHGTLSYESPEQAVIPEDAVVEGGVTYAGPSYLPASSQTHALALASFGVFLFVRFLAAVILAGLIAGLFPRPVAALARRAFNGSIRSVSLTFLLGLGVLVAAPLVLVLLALTFVGLGIALFGAALYALLLILAFIGSGMLVGLFLARRIEKRDAVLWRDGAVGMLVLSFAGLIPVVGALLDFLLIAFVFGALVLALFQGAFPKEESADLI